MSRYPLLFIAFAVILGCGLCLYPHWIYLFPFACFLCVCERKWLFVAVVISSFLYTICLFSPLPKGSVEGRGVFTAHAISPSAAPFGKSYAIKGCFTSFEAAEKTYQRVPCTIYLPKVPQSGTRWWMEGTLKKGIFKPNQQTTWTPYLNHFSFVRWRFQTKQRLSRWIDTKILDPHTAAFFSALCTGNCDHLMLKMEFQKVGLGHILAISGFHFALLAGILILLLSLVFSRKKTIVLLLLLLCGYFLFLGPTPSITRAYLMITLYLCGTMLSRKVLPLNLMGAALIIEVLYNPRVLSQTGFLFSFLATIGILGFYQPIKKALSSYFPLEPTKEIVKKKTPQQLSYLTQAYFHNALALSGSIYFTTLPLHFFLFPTFSLISIPYNLLVQPLLTVSIALVPFSLLLPPLRFVHIPFTKWVLSLVSAVPETLNHQLFIESLPFELLVATLTLIILCPLTKSPQTS